MSMIDLIEKNHIDNVGKINWEIYETQNNVTA
jgi:hypothetical protein